MMESEEYFHTDEMPKEIRRRKKQLYNAIKERMEFYFSDANIQKDRFLAKLIEDDPEVDLAVFLRFNRIQQLTHSVHDLAKALKKSEVLQLNEDKTKVSRVAPIKMKENVDACTIYVEQLTPDADHDWLTKIFSKYGKVDYVSIPKYKNSGKIKGFAFVEFEKPEYAEKALEEFEKEGLCLTSHMSPEQLCSIATFEEDKPEKADGKESAAQQEKGNEPDKTEDESKKKAKKRKTSESSKEIKEEEPEEKKIKKEETESENENASADDNHVNNENSDCKTENQDETENAEAPSKKKKNRKKKKSHKMKYVDDIKLYGLHILSKTDWKRLRNKYLNIQKEKMKRLKQHLYKSQLNHMQRQQQVADQQQQPPPTKPRFEFSTELVIKISFEEALADNNQVAQFKSDAKSLDSVEYVDVAVGSTEGYIRFRDKETVNEIMQSKPWENMSVLEGKDEEEYWDKMKKDRAEKFENRKKFNNKKRGRNKLVNKAEKLISKRIRLSVDE